MSYVAVITGPTACGKTELGALLAKRLNGEVVSADSMQIYRGMDIGTAKPTAAQMDGVPHHMIGLVTPLENYSVARYVEDASACCDDIIARGRLPIVVGGTGLYIDSLISGRDFAPAPRESGLRDRYSALYDERGGEETLRILAERDPARAAKLHPNDKKRVVRALEAAETGVPLTEHDAATKSRPPRYGSRVIVLNFRDRVRLYERINARVDDMMARGLEGEVRALISSGAPRDCTAMQAIGYKEIAAALAGETTLEEAVELIKLRSRRYAKRQISWCARYTGALRIEWEKIPDFSGAIARSTDFLK